VKFNPAGRRHCVVGAGKLGEMEIAAAMATRSVAVSTGLFGHGSREVARAVGGGAIQSSSLLGMKSSRLLGVKLRAPTGGQVVAAGVSRVQCRVAVATPRVKDDLMAEAEERWYNALESPLEGVEFTYEEFADALSKYDFSFEIGDTVSTHDMLSYMSFCQSTMLDSGVEFLIEF
jgi:hypothetical protein